ncbi:MAG: hypothetical protein ACLUG6_13615 [Lachnospira eligens]
MHILAFILIFIVGSIIAACDGDYSGIAAIGKICRIFCITIRSIRAIYPAGFIDNCYCCTGFNCDRLLCKVAYAG